MSHEIRTGVVGVNISPSEDYGNRDRILIELRGHSGIEVILKRGIITQVSVWGNDEKEAEQQSS